VTSPRMSLAGNGFTVPVDVVTTDTNRFTQVFQISGTTFSPGPSPVPEPGTAGLVLVGWATLAGFRRMRG